MEDNKKVVKMDDVAGYEEEKVEISKIVRLLNDYDRYEKLGIAVPKGLILQGPPGTGKTLLAKAISGECNIPFFSFQPSDNADSILKDLNKVFEEASKHKPAVVYIDEIDKIVTNRHFNSDSARAVVQFLLTKLDGISSKSGMMVIASTNCYSDIPRALLRSGRIDKKIIIDVPNLDSRIKILNYYIKDKDIFKDLDVKRLAIKIDGLSGADIKTLINNALIEYIDTKDSVEVDDFQKLINEMHFETIGKKWNNKNCLTRVLAHEIGHALIQYDKEGIAGAITGVRYGSVAGFNEEPYEYELRDDDDEPTEPSLTKSELAYKVRRALGGMAAEIVYYGEPDLGISGDINQVNALFDLCSEYGLFGFKTMPKYFREDAEYKKEILTRERDKFFKKELHKAVKIIKKYKYLGMHLIDKAKANNDALSEKEINFGIELYTKSKKSIDKAYKREKRTLNED